MTDSCFWNNYYAGTSGGDSTLVVSPSSFAEMLVEKKYVIPGKGSLIDVGAGNGRDSLYLAGLVEKVCALDYSPDGVTKMRSMGLDAVQGDMGDMDKDMPVFDVVYSRFSLHSITEEAQESFFSWAESHCRTLCIETRSVNDPRYGVGEKADEFGGYVDTHYRRFTRLSDLTRQLSSLGFDIVLACEDFHSSHHENDKSVVNRVIARKQTK